MNEEIIDMFKDEDRLSALPDALCCHILSFIETKYAVRTSALSTRWKTIWTSVPSLYFCNLNQTEKPKNDPGFFRFVIRVLLLHDSLDIPKFRIDCYCAKDNIADIDTWIRTVIRHNVVELDLSLSTSLSYLHPFFKLPECIFTCKTLQVLKLHSNSFTYRLPKSGRFPSLKFLQVTITGCYKCAMRDFNNLLSQLPILEHLIINLQGVVIFENFSLKDVGILTNLKILRLI
ncbi:F-box/LRR-repeat protein At3g59200-like [Argentina anserina]|uniref:F-box/LRR-repeat protein At3g59200-like n=1 Tax=Argentina anserina TaxID=57926 RepID=UPI0021766F78|nr:F-box/LRR-repeat protein At3g59200-like [Potentilla anserina]